MKSIEHVQEHLLRGSVAELAVACKLEPIFCRKHFRLEKLLAVVRGVPRLLAPGGDRRNSVLAELRDEIIFRLLITADRESQRDLFLSLVSEELFADPALSRFVTSHYWPRNLSKFAESESAYLNALLQLHGLSTVVERAIGQALAWLGALPGSSRRQTTRVLFSNAELCSRFPGLLVSGRCLTFSFKSKRATNAFSHEDQTRVSSQFTAAAHAAEVEAQDILNRDQSQSPLLKHLQLTIESDDKDASFLDGASGYLAFLMAHRCRLQSQPLSPYVGLTGAKPVNELLGLVDHLPQKIQAARDAGLMTLLVPRSAFEGLTVDERQSGAGLKIETFDDRQAIKLVADELSARFEEWQPQLTMTLSHSVQRHLEAAHGSSSSSEGRDVSVSERPVALVAKDVAAVAESAIPPLPTRPAAPSAVALLPVRPFRLKYAGNSLKSFREYGSDEELGTRASLSVFTSDGHRFLTAFPDAGRLFLFDADEGLLVKRRTGEGDIPVGLCWCEPLAEFLIGLSTGVIHRCNFLLEPESSFRLSAGFVPRHMIYAAGALFVSDGEFRLARVLPGGVPEEFQFPERILQLGFSEGHDRLLISFPGRVVAFQRTGQPDWQIEHQSPSAIFACAPNGEIWLSLSTGRLQRRSAEGQQVLVDVALPSVAQSLVVLDRLAVVGFAKGELGLFDLRGRELGRDRLGVGLSHLVAGAADLLVASTDTGVSVLTPNATLVTASAGQDSEAIDRATRTLMGWEQDLKSGRAIASAVRGFVKELNLVEWPFVIAFQEAYRQREQISPAECFRIREFMERQDARKAACLCRKTRPVIVDGTNVARDHWHDRKGLPSRLAAILRMRAKLEEEQNPVLFPIIVVVDNNEKRLSDDQPELLRLISNGEILAATANREADALILTLVKQHNWMTNCEIVSNDKGLLEAHREMLPEADRAWYENVRRAFTIDPKNLIIQFISRSRR